MVGLVRVSLARSAGGRIEGREGRESKYSIKRNSTKKITTINLHTHHTVRLNILPNQFYIRCSLLNAEPTSTLAPYYYGQVGVREGGI